VGVLVRVPLAILAVALIAWFGVLLHDQRVRRTSIDRIFFAPHLTDAQVQQEVDRLKGARRLNPDPSPDLDRAGVLLLHGRAAEAAAIARARAHAEPANITAWSLLERATRRSDPAESAAARAQIRRLNPLATFPAPAGRTAQAGAPAAPRPTP
jgi:hypothetical protein